MLRILVVEDNPITRKMFRVTLESEGYGVVEAGDAAAALEALRGPARDVVLVLQDLVLPDMDGFELARSVRALPGMASIPLIAVSGYLGKVEEAEGARLGFTDYLFKPVEPSRLLSAIRGWITTASQSPSKGGQALRVLVVDDDPVQLRLAAVHLKIAGYDVVTAKDGVEALEIARRDPPAAILSDVLMPRLDGFRLCAEVRRDPALERTPLVLISAAYDEESDRSLAAAVGANKLLSRAGGLDELGEAVRAAIESGPPVFDGRATPELPLEEYTHRVIRQLERLASSHASLARRVALQEAELSMLGGLAESVRLAPVSEQVVDGMVQQCIDAAGVSMGAAYLVDREGALALRTKIGWPDHGPGGSVAGFFGRQDLLRRALDGGAPMRILAIEADANDRALLERIGARSLLLTPLRAGSERLGVFVVASSGPTLSDDWVAFVGACGVQIGQALALARAFAGREAFARRQQAFTDLGFLALRGGDPQELFQAAAKTVATALGVECAGVVEVPPGSPVGLVRATFGMRAPPETTPAVPGSQLAFALGSSSPVVIRDLAGEARFTPAPALLERGFRSGVEVPIPGEGRPFGVLAAFTERARGFDVDDIAFAQSVAQGLATAVARRRAEQRLQVEHAATSAIAQSATMKEAAPLVLGALARRGFVYGAVWTPDAKVARLRCRATWVAPDLDLDTSAFDAATITGARGPGEGIIGRVAATHAAVWIPDLSLEPEFLRREEAAPAGLRSGVVFPIRRGAETLGVVELYARSVRPSDAETLEILGHVGTQLGEFQGRLRSAEALHDSELQLRQAQKMEAVGRLAGGVAHDFNNLLTAILGHCDLASQIMQPGDPGKEDIDEIRKAGVRAAQLTQQLLAFSRKQVLEPRVLDLGAIVTSARQMLRRLIGEDLVLRFALEPSLGRVRADPGQVEQIVLNLCVNARDAMPRGGNLTIETANVTLDTAHSRPNAPVAPGAYVMLAVSDTGTGMDAETQSHLFEPFFTTKEPGKGTGLGLSTVYGIVQQSGGHITVYSEVGRGSTFKIYLPRVDAPLPPQETRAASPGAYRGTETVLVVEDEDIVRDLAVRVLGMYGYKVLSARHGNEAIPLAEKFEGRIHALITDVVMPHMSGPDVARKICEKRLDLRVVFLSGYTEKAITQYGVPEENLFFLAKPFSTEALARKVREALDAGKK